MRIGVVRISAEENEQHRYQLKKHLKALSEAGAERLFYDVESRTADLEQRPGLQAMFELIDTGVVSEVITPDVERLTVNMGLLEQVRKKLRDRDIPLIALNMGGIDLCSDIGELLSTIAAAGGKYEWNRIQKRIKRNADYEKRHGLLKRAPFGYRLNKGIAEFDLQPFLCLLETREELSKYAIALILIEFLFKHQTVNSTIAAVHNHFGIYLLPATRLKKTEANSNSLTPEDIDNLLRLRAWQSSRFQLSYQGFRNWLINPLLFNAISVPVKNVDPALWERRGIIDEEMHKQICFLVQNRSPFKRSGRYSKANIFYRKVFCANCGRPASVVGGGTKRSNGKEKKVYLAFQCSQWIKERSRLRLDPDAIISCNNRQTIQLTAIEQAVVDRLVEYAHDLAEEALRKAQNSDSPEITTPEIEKLKEEIRTLKSTGIKAVEATIKQMERELEAARSKLQAQKKKRSQNEEMIIACFSQREFWLSRSQERKREIISQVVDRIEILNGEISAIELH